MNMENQEANAATLSESRTASTALLNKAGALLLDAAGMLRMEADEWRARSNRVPSDWNVNDRGSWADRCERIAVTNIAAATSMSETAKKIAAVVGA